MLSTKLKPKPNPSQLILDFEAIGTRWIIELSAPDTMHADLQAAVIARIEQFDRNYSRFRSDSLVTTMSKKAGRYRLQGDGKAMLDLYQELYELTDGLVTPLIGQTLSDAGYDANYSLQSKPLSKPPKWDEVLAYSFPELTLKKQVLLDFGACGKGYLVDIIGELLASRGVNTFLINAGGDIVHRGTEPIEIGLEHPENPDEAIGIFNLDNKALCGSAGNRRIWGAYHHIINPQTLASPTDIRALWVSAETTLLADGLSTALFFVHPKVLQKRYNFTYAILAADYSLSHSPDFPARFFTEAH